VKYIYENGARTFRGYFFWNSKPVEITDRATLQAIQKEDGFKVFEEEPAPVMVANPDACGKCGKVVKQGRYMLEKFCRGAK
jgi:hypothetical protein